MTITLTPELERLVQEKVDRGEYESADAFVGEAVQRLIGASSAD
jgi:Arc/MetJ-type ribon-helix-helix transcriptional regulator